MFNIEKWDCGNSNKPLHIYPHAHLNYLQGFNVKCKTSNFNWASSQVWIIKYFKNKTFTRINNYVILFTTTNYVITIVKIIVSSK